MNKFFCAPKLWLEMWYIYGPHQDDYNPLWMELCGYVKLSWREKDRRRTSIIPINSDVERGRISIHIPNPFSIELFLSNFWGKFYIRFFRGINDLSNNFDWFYYRKIIAFLFYFFIFSCHHNILTYIIILHICVCVCKDGF